MIPTIPGLGNSPVVAPAIAVALAGAVILLQFTPVSLPRRRRRLAPVTALPVAPPPVPAPADDPRFSRVTGRLGAVILLLVALIGAVLSFDNLRRGAEPAFGAALSWLAPAIVDALILGCTLRYVAGVRRGRAVASYRIMAWAGIAATVYLNALASQDAYGLSWHVAAPAVWAWIIEAAAKDALGDYEAVQPKRRHRHIPLRLWLTTHPVTTVRVLRHIDRTGAESYLDAIREVGVTDAAVQAVRLALPGKSDGAPVVRRMVTGYLRRGILAPERAAGLLDDTGPARTPQDVLRALLEEILADRPRGRARAPRALRADRAVDKPHDPHAADLAARAASDPSHTLDRAVGTEYRDPARQRVFETYCARLDEDGREMTTAEIMAACGVTDAGRARSIRSGFRDKRAARQAAVDPGGTLDGSDAWEDFADERIPTPVG